MLMTAMSKVTNIPTLLKNANVTGVQSHAYNPSTVEMEAAGWQIQGQSGLYIETVSMKQSKAKQNRC